MMKKQAPKTQTQKSSRSHKRAESITTKSTKGPGASTSKTKKHTASAPIGTPPPMFDSERFNQLIGKMITESGLTDIDEINAYLQEHIIGKPLDDLLGEQDEDPIFRAQELAYQSMEAESAKEALPLAQEALEHDPNCVDALMQVALLTAGSTQQRIRNVHDVVTRTEAKLGEDYFEENRGHFWGLTETRPYMRALEAYAEMLRASGRDGEAITVCERMLDLNPGDNQGIRDILLGLYLQTGDLEGARKLFKAYGDSAFAVFAWGRVLERFLAGEMGAAAKAYNKAMKTNRFVAEYLTAKRRIPEQSPGYYSLGDENEAAHCIDLIGRAWVKAPKALEWLSKRGQQ